MGWETLTTSFEPQVNRIFEDAKHNVADAGHSSVARLNAMLKGCIEAVALDYQAGRKGGKASICGSNIWCAAAASPIGQQTHQLQTAVIVWHRTPHMSQD